MVTIATFANMQNPKNRPIQRLIGRLIANRDPTVAITPNRSRYSLGPFNRSDTQLNGLTAD